MSPRKIPEDELLGELQRLADDLGEPPTMQEMDESGQYSAQTYIIRFGSWNDSLRSAGLEPQNLYKIPEEELVDELQCVSDELGKPPTISDFREWGEYSVTSYQDIFGSWDDALRAAGFEPYSERAGVSTWPDRRLSGEFFEDLERDAISPIDPADVETGASIEAETVVYSNGNEQRKLSTGTTLDVNGVKFRVDGFKPAVGGRGRFGWMVELRWLGDYSGENARLGVRRTQHAWLDEIVDWIDESSPTEP